MGNKNILAMSTELWWSLFYTVVIRHRIIKSAFHQGREKLLRNWVFTVMPVLFTVTCVQMVTRE